MSRKRKMFIAVTLVVTALAVGNLQASVAHAESPPTPQELCMFSPSPHSAFVEELMNKTVIVFDNPNAVCPPPRVSIWASPPSVPHGGYTTLNWTTEYVDIGCDASPTGPGWSGSKGQNGSQGGIGSINGSVTFGLVCTGTGGTGSNTVTVTSYAPSPPPPPPPPPPPSPPACNSNSSALVNGGSPPATVQVNQTFSVQITFRNTGTCTWTRALGFKLGLHTPRDDASAWGLSRVELSPSDAIANNQTKTFVVNAKAPATPGARQMGWRMVREGVQWFGPETPVATINVVSSSPPPPVNCNSDPSIRDYALCDQFGSPETSLIPVAAYRRGPVHCRQAKAYAAWKQIITGLWFWKYHQDIEWCWDNNRITSIDRNRWGEKNSFPGNPWGFEGHQSSNCNTENCSDKAFGQSQLITTGGKFHACALVVVFCNTKNPNIEIRINRGGGVQLVRATP